MLHVTTTCPDLATARLLAEAALSQRLAACANILPQIRSLYRWQGRIADDAEVQIVFKTTEARRAALIEVIAGLHPYDLPVITWETVGTTPAATEWLMEETR